CYLLAALLRIRTRRRPPTAPPFPYTTLFRSGVQDLAHTEIVDRRTEEHRRLAACQEGVVIEGRDRAGDQLDLLAGLGVGVAEPRRQFGIVQPVDGLVVVPVALRAGAEDPHPVVAQVEDPAEMAAHAHRPG